MSGVLGLGAYDESGSDESPAPSGGASTPAGDGTHPAADLQKKPSLLSIVDYQVEDAEEENAEAKARAADQLRSAADDDALDRTFPSGKVSAVGASFSVVRREVKRPAAVAGDGGGGGGASGASSAANDGNGPGAVTLGADGSRGPFVPPDSPPGGADPRLLEKYDRQIRATRECGQTVNDYIRNMKRFRNPCLLEKLVDFLKVQEFGTNYPPDLYDPTSFEEGEFYEKLEETRREWEARQARKQGERVEFRSAGAQQPSQPPPPAVVQPPPAAADPPKRKSKWDTGGSDAKVPRV
jgi:hypothetical protein